MSTASLPLRTAIIGLSASAVTSWASAAHLPALLSERGRKDYKITALLNSSVGAAEAAIKAYDLPAETKAYGSPADLADDADVDVVIVNTRVDKHFEVVADSVRAGKMAYIEWPVTGNVEDTRQLVRLAEQSGSKVAVGVQGRWAPPVAKIREIVESGRLGKVVSSGVVAYGGTMSRDALPVGLKYFSDWKVGGNPITIGFAHMIDMIQSAVGEFVEGTTVAKTQLQFPKNRLFDPQTKETVGAVESDVPDRIVVAGNLSSSKFVSEGATLAAMFRRGPPFQGEPAFKWSVTFEQGELQLVAPEGPALQAASNDSPPTIQIQHFGDNTVEDVPWSFSDAQTGLPGRARSVYSALCAFAEGDENGYPSLKSAANRAEQIDAWVKRGSW